MSRAQPGLAGARVLVVGVGGLGCPAASILARSGVGRITLLDDDRVELSNLHRQPLFGAADVGRPKADVAARALTSLARAAGRDLETVAREIRLVPGNALDQVTGHDLVVEGSDTFATKFLAADACALAGVPVVQAGAVRWGGWALASVPGRAACLRCVFEDIPAGAQATCAAAGIVGAVVGVVGALQAALALRVLLGDATAAGEMWSYAGLPGTLRRRSLARRTDCPLCSGGIRDTEGSRYAPPECAA
jgi:adenylyltransferase/sulfurtransferase